MNGEDGAEGLPAHATGQEHDANPDPNLELRADEPLVGPESLPFPAALSHSLFLVEPFDASSFLLTRKHVLLDDLRSELRVYLAALRSQLVAIINSDYEDFINLGGSHLLGSEAQMSYRMRKPLEGISREIREAREELLGVRGNLQERLEKRDQIRSRKAMCRKLLGVNEQVVKVEEMLLISPQSTTDDAVPGQDQLLRTPSLAKQQGLRRVSAAQQKIDRSMGSDTKRIERIAQEYNQLLYLVRKSEGLRFVESLQPRIDRISSTLQQDLSSLLSSTIASLHQPPTSASNLRNLQAEQRARIEALTNLFRTYASIQKYREAEEVIRRQVVSDFIVRTIHREALLAPQSPMMPVTPFQGFGSIGSVLTAAATAASPSLSSAAGSFPFNLPSATSAAASPSTFERQQQQGPPQNALSSALIDERSAIPPFYLVDPIQTPTTTSAADTYISDALVDLYNKLLIFISKDLGLILEIAERRPAQGVSSVTTSGPGREANNATPDGEGTTVPGSPATKERALVERAQNKPGYEILSNVLWNEIAQRLMTECGHLIFSAGRPETFHRNYLATLAFMSRLESLCPSLRYLQILRNNPNFIAFMKRWQLPVYFQLRFKEIVGSLENTLSVHTISPAPSAIQSTPLILAASEAVHRAISTCWNEDIFLPDLSGRFWRLTLQIISRYRTWLDASLPDYVGNNGTVGATGTAVQALAGTAGPAALQRSASGVGLQRLLPTSLTASTSSRPSTPQPSSTPASDEQTDEDALRKLSIVIFDTLKLQQLIMQLFETAISPKLPKLGGGSIMPVDGEDDTPEATLAATLSSITSLTPSLLSQLVTILSKRCSEPLRLVRSGASQVRANTKAKAGTLPEPSYFVPNILRPARVYLDGAGKVLPTQEKQALVQGLFEDLAIRYEAALAKMKKDGDALRRLKRGRQGTGFSLFGRGNAAAAQDDAAGPSAEDERIKEQMGADVEAFAKDAESLGADLSSSEALKALRSVVEDWSK